MKLSRLQPGVVLGLCLGLIACAMASPGVASADGYQVQSTSLWMQNAAPVGWTFSPDRVIYNSRGADGMIDAYSANPDGTDARCLTCDIPAFPGVGTATNRGASDVSPDGRYMLLTVENPDGSQTGASYTEPGKGYDNDVWLATTDGSQAWPLTDIHAAGQTAIGTMWARFDRTGDEIVWASLYAPAVANLGYWQLKVANIVWDNGVPSLSDIRTIEPQPDRFYEPYGFTPDDSHILFASDANMPTWTDSQIDEISTDGTGLTRLSPADAPPGVFNDYNEFAFFTPDKNWIVYGRTRNATSGGMDYWIMAPDGTSSQRLTYFNSPWSTESMGYSVVGAAVFDPHDPDRFLVHLGADLAAHNINAVMVTLAPQTATSGLREQFFADPAFGQPVTSTTGDPSSGFQANAAPAAGVPPTGYSIRWSGSLIPPATGTYTFCAVADHSDQLRLNGHLLIDGSYSPGQRRCAPAGETAGAPVPIEFDYTHGAGTAYAQISWIPPGTTTPSIIPDADLVPGGATAAAASAPAIQATAASTSGHRRGRSHAAGTTRRRRGHRRQRAPRHGAKHRGSHHRRARRRRGRQKSSHRRRRTRVIRSR